jgi:hypothetical protein
MGWRPAPNDILDPIGADVIGNLPAVGKLEWPMVQASLLRKQMYGVRT